LTLAILQKTGYGGVQSDGLPSTGEQQAPFSEFQALIRDHMAEAALDEDAPDSQADSESSATPSGWKPTPLAELFQLDGNQAWLQCHETYMNISFDQELELYDFLDMDAEGEDEDIENHDILAQEILEHGFPEQTPSI
jgi:hypothetical protein